MDALSVAVAVFDSGVRLSVPLLFACLAGLWSERAGVVDAVTTEESLVWSLVMRKVAESV